MSVEDFEGGEVLICGGTDWSMLGKSGGKKTDKDKQEEAARAERYPNLLSPTRIKNLVGVRIRFIAAGSAACHTILGDMEGNCYTFGRNDKGQLGHGDTVQRNMPTLVEALCGQNIIKAAAGRHHSALVTAEGHCYSFGSNLHGQCGTGSLKSKDKQEELLTSPVRIGVEGCSGVACGIDFSMWLCGGDLFSAGNPQYGQLGHGTDHEYNMKDSSIKIAYMPQPSPKLIEAFADCTVVNMACGHNHSLAIDDKGRCWSWGNGGYGRLGHVKQQDEFTPRAIDTFKGRLTVPVDAVLAAGATSSFCSITGGQLYAWGKLKNNGDSVMYPKPLTEIAGWSIADIACGAVTFALAASYQQELAVVTWGHGSYGELGYGPKGKKSSANPDKCPALDGVRCYQVACGIGHTCFLVDPGSEVLESLEVWECDAEEAAAEVPAEATGGKGKKGAAGKKTNNNGTAAPAGKRKREEPAPKAKAKAKGKGKGKK